MRINFRRFLYLFTLILYLGCTNQEVTHSKKTLNIAVAANMQFAMREIVAKFEQKENVNVELMIGASGKLTNQIINGAPFHLFVSADTSYTQEIIKAGKGVRNQYIYAIGSLVLWTNNPKFKETNLFSLLEKETVSKISIPNPITSPYGLQAKLALEKAGLWKKISSKIVVGESIAQSTQYVYARICEIGFTAKSVLYSPELKDKGIWQEVPSHLYKQIYQGLIITKWGEEKNKMQVESFLSFMKSMEVKKILFNNGYQLPLKE
ncbi:MAG: molybdate transporter substrate-binding protein [Bacteroidota bacterium]